MIDNLRWRGQQFGVGIASIIGLGMILYIINVYTEPGVVNARVNNHDGGVLRQR